jgi:hypothetical protein
MKTAPTVCDRCQLANDARTWLLHDYCRGGDCTCGHGLTKRGK